MGTKLREPVGYPLYLGLACRPRVRKAHLFGEVLDNAVFRHLGADGKTALELLLNAAQHLLVLLGSEALHPCESAIGNWVLETPVHPYWEGQRDDSL